MAFPADQAPVLLSNRYRVLNVLSDGGFGKTYLVEDAHMPSGRQCVLKQLKPIEDDPEAAKIVRDRFQREAAIQERLGETHDQIPRLYAYFAQDDQFYLVTEWIEGYTLTQKVRADGPQTESVVKRTIAELLEPIAYVHRQGILHRDIKPDNAILRRQDGKPVLIDFGAVKETMQTQLSLDNGSQGSLQGGIQPAHTIAIGTPGYMPAEQLSGRPTYASDLYSLGMTAIYLLTGRIPQELDADDSTGEWLWRHYVPGISAEFGNFLDCAIHRDPRTRFPSAESMLSILNTLIADDASRRVAGFELGSPEPDPTIAPPPYRRAETAATVGGAVGSGERVGNVYGGQGDPTYEVSAYEREATAPPVARSGSWLNAVVIGSMVGFGVLFGVLFAMDRLPNVFARGGIADVEDIAPVTPTETPPDEDKPAQTVTTVGSVPNANGTIAGQPGSKNVRAKAGTIFAKVDAVEVGDRVRVTQKGADEEGNAWYQITTPSGTTGWIAGQLLQIDGNATVPSVERNRLSATVSRTRVNPTDTDSDSSSSSSSGSSSSGSDSSKPTSSTTPKPQAANSTSTATNPPADRTNAVLIGEPGSKNIRSGPGVSYGKVHEAFPGDRVVIKSSDTDADGYTWYEVAFPESGAEGWIAAQLVKRD